MITIRPLTPQDAAQYRQLRLRMLRAHPSAFTSSFEEESAKALDWSQRRLAPRAERPHDFFLGAFEGDELVGMVGVEGRYRLKERHNASVVGMYVAPQLTGQGIGLGLMHALLKRARALEGLEQLDLTVTAGNDPAQDIYARCGFTVVGALPRAIKVDAQYYAKVQMALHLR